VPNKAFRRVLLKDYLLSVSALISALIFGRFMFEAYLRAMDMTVISGNFYWLLVALFILGYLLCEVWNRLFRNGMNNRGFHEQYSHLSRYVEDMSTRIGVKTPRLAVEDRNGINGSSEGRLLFQSKINISVPAIALLPLRHNEAILAHEMAHIRLNHSMFSFFTAYALKGSVELLLIPLMLKACLAPSFVYIPLSLGWFALRQLSEFLLFWLSRQNEFSADALGALCMKSPEAMIELGQILKELKQDAPCSRLEYLFRSHPTPDERIAKLQHLLNDA